MRANLVLRTLPRQVPGLWPKRHPGIRYTGSAVAFLAREVAHSARLSGWPPSLVFSLSTHPQNWLHQMPQDISLAS